MVDIEQVKRGVVSYINRDIAPLAPKPLSIGIAAFGPLVAEAKIKEFIASGLFNGTGIVQDNLVDIDEIVRLVKPAAEGKWPVQMFGFTFNESDLDKLYRYIKEA